MTEVMRNGIAGVYASLIIQGEYLFKDVPDMFKEDVRAILIQMGYEHLIIE